MERDKADLIADKLRAKYINRMEKKKANKPLAVQIIMDRTFSSAFAILGFLDDIPFNKLTFNVYFFCKDIEFREIVKLYDSQLELAGANQEKFIFGLHSFYNNVSNKLKKENKYYEFAQFIGAALRLQYEKKEALDENIINAYLCLILQTLEYLRTDKFDLNTYPYGVSTNGELLMGPYPLAFSDVPVMEYERLVRNGKKINSSIEHIDLIKGLYRKYGIEINSMADLDVLRQTQQIHCNTASALFPFINEFTYDITTTTAFESTGIPFEHMLCLGVNAASLIEKLKHRNRTLPTNGVRFEIEDPLGEIEGLLLKEIVYNDSVYMLYKLELLGSSLSGYFDTNSGFFYSIMRQAKIPEPFAKVSAFVLAMYATQVLNTVSLEKVSKLFIQGRQLMTIKAFGKAGKIKDTYHLSPAKSGAVRDLEHYNKEERHINVIIRNLPEGQQASEEAKELAAQYGYDLGPNQTFVRPFIKQVFVRKDRGQNQQGQDNQEGQEP